MSDVRLAIVGAGVIGKRHALAMSLCERAELVAFADPDQSAVKTAEQSGVPLFNGLDELIEATSPDGVIIATPTENHVFSTVATLEAGIPVLVEKPVTATMEEAEKIIRLSERKDVPVLVGHQRRYYGLVEETKRIIELGELGQLVMVSGLWAMRKHDSYYEPDWRKKWQAGPVLTNLIHELDLLRYICGDIASVSAETGNMVQGFEKEDAAVLIMRFTNGALGTFALSDQATSPWSWERATGENAAFPPTGQNAIRFAGTKAALDFPNLTLWQHGEAEPEWRTKISAADRSVETADPYITQIEHFADVICGLDTPRSDASDAAASLRATLAVYESALSGKRVLL